MTFEEGAALTMQVDLTRNTITLHATYTTQLTVSAPMLAHATSWQPVAVLLMPGDLVSLTSVRPVLPADAPPSPRRCHHAYPHNLPAEPEEAELPPPPDVRATRRLSAAAAAAAAAGLPMHFHPMSEKHLLEEMSLRELLIASDCF